MNSSFLKFKRKASGIRVLKSLLAGASAGLILGGTFLILSKLAILSPAPIIALPVAVAAFLLFGGGVYLALRGNDLSLAKRLDEEFALHERVQTMIEHSGGDTEMLQMQREDTEAVLAGIDLRRFKAKRIWIYIIAMVLGAAVFATSIAIPNRRNSEGEYDAPFSLSNMQRAGLNELVAYVEASEMDEQYRARIADELRSLIADLEVAERMSDMQACLAESMAYILQATSDSSSSAELLDALWKSGDVHLQYLALTLETSTWSSPDWGDYAEKLTEYIGVMTGEIAVRGSEEHAGEESGKQNLVWALDSSGRKIPLALGSSGIPATDPLYAVINKLATANEPKTKGYAALAQSVATLSYDEARLAVQEAIDGMSGEMYDVISHLRVNAVVGEYTMTKLSTLFLVPLPEFERPGFVKNKESINDGSSGADGNKDNENGPSDGGIGEGATFGSKDLVLDPITGNYVEYGTLIDKYYAVMFEKLENGSYTDEQKKMIENYFALLYGGMEKEEGN